MSKKDKKTVPAPSPRWGKGLIAGLIIAIIGTGLIYFVRKTQANKIDVPSYRIKGPANAKVTIVEFSDFQCPACRSAQPVLRKIQEEFPKGVRVAFRHLPLERPHKWARTMAIAAECAGKQEKFWPFHDLVYERQRVWSEATDVNPFIFEMAREVGLATDPLSECMNDSSINAMIDKDLEASREMNVRSTPTFFVNGERYVGGRQLGNEGYAAIRLVLKAWKKPDAPSK